MSNAIVGLCTLDFHLPGVQSLKEKRSIIKSMMSRLRKHFNASAAEVDYHDKWQSTQIAIVTVSNSTKHAQQMVNEIIKWVEANYPDMMITDQEIEII